MEITGRITADAQVKTLQDKRQLVSFSIAINDNYRTKDGTKQSVSTYFNCAYWLNTSIAHHLKKSSIVTVYGSLRLNTYQNKDGEFQASLNFHVNDIKFVSMTSSRQSTAEATQAEELSDLPF